MTRANYNSAHSLDRAARAHPDRDSIFYGGTRLSVVESAHKTRQLAQMLTSAGVSKGDRVAVIARNSPYHLLIHVACARIGAISVPISYRLARPELEDLLEFCAPRAIVVDPETARDGLFDLTFSTASFVIDDDEHAPSFSAAVSAGFYALSAAMDSYDGRFITISSEGITSLNSRVYEEGSAALLFTSGSTGAPKGVCLTHEQLWWGSRNFREGFEYSNLDVELVVAPLSHIGGFNGTTLDIFSHGGTVVVVREFDPGEVLRQLSDHRVQIMFAVPTMYAALMNHPAFEATDLSHFRLPLIGGAQSPPALLSRMESAGLRPLNVWGMTEIAASGCYLPHELLDSHRGSIGRPFAHTEARIRDVSTGEDANEGELLVRGPSVISQYWHDEEYSKHAFDGAWLRTGDVVRQDSEGYLWVVGRLHHQINSGGEKIAPEEVAATIAQMDAVSDVAVVGVPDVTWGEVVGAVVVPRESASDLDLDAVRAFAEPLLARYKLPKLLRVVDQIPTNANGKPDTGALKALFSD